MYTVCVFSCEMVLCEAKAAVTSGGKKHGTVLSDNNPLKRKPCLGVRGLMVKTQG